MHWMIHYTNQVYCIMYNVHNVSKQLFSTKLSDNSIEKACLWNELPNDVKDIESYLSFTVKTNVHYHFKKIRSHKSVDCKRRRYGGTQH